MTFFEAILSSFLFFQVCFLRKRKQKKKEKKKSLVRALKLNEKLLKKNFFFFFCRFSRRQTKRKMGKRKRKNQKKNGNREAGSQNYVRTELPTTNEMFIEYYKGLKILDDVEWEAFWTACHDPLPTTFRITKSSPYHDLVRTRLKEYFSVQLKAVELEDGRKPEPPYPLPWYPDELGWGYALGRNDIRKNRTLKALQEFHYFLTTQTENGLISRQEAVSMIPPFFLQVEPHHSVLDMCAAPGSKTCQIVEFLDRDPNRLPSILSL